MRMSVGLLEILWPTTVTKQTLYDLLIYFDVWFYNLNCGRTLEEPMIIYRSTVFFGHAAIY